MSIDLKTRLKQSSSFHPHHLNVAKKRSEDLSLITNVARVPKGFKVREIEPSGRLVIRKARKSDAE